MWLFLTSSWPSSPSSPFWPGRPGSTLLPFYIVPFLDFFSDFRVKSLKFLVLNLRGQFGVFLIYRPRLVELISERKLNIYSLKPINLCTQESSTVHFLSTSAQRGAKVGLGFWSKWVLVGSDQFELEWRMEIYLF